MYDIDLIYSIFVHKSVYYIQIRFKLNVYKGTQVFKYNYNISSAKSAM